MANQQRGELGVDVDGKRYTLRPTFDSICELEDLIGKTVDADDGPMSAMVAGRRSGFRAVVWCLLRDEHADEIKTLKDASRWIERAGGLDVVMVWLERIFAMNEPPEELREPPVGTSGSGNGGAAHPQGAQAGTDILTPLVGSV